MNNAVYLIVAVVALAFFKRYRKKGPPLPPGPPSEPILGHARVIPSENPELAFHEWGKIYGDVIHLKTPGGNLIVLNSVDAASDLLDKRGAIYSDRPEFPLFDYMGWAGILVFAGYGKAFQTQRRLLQDYINIRKIVNYRDLQTLETHTLLKNLLQEPDHHLKHLHRFTTSIITSISYGFRIESGNDDYMQTAAKVNQAMNHSGTPGATPIDVLPILRYLPNWFPGTFYAQHARNNQEYIRALFDAPFEKVVHAMSAGNGKPSFTMHNLEKQQREGSNDPDMLHQIKLAAGTMYAAATDTTTVTFSCFVYNMVANPECQRRAQAEIDSVVGPGRLPNFDDRKSMLFVDGICQEILRWHPATPLAVPHRAIKEDIYNGMYIPAGSVVIANLRPFLGMTLDERVCRNPKQFDPARYLPAPEGNNEPYPILAFGFGRRRCPGRHLADANLWLSIASMLATFDFCKSLDAEGREIEPKLEVTAGLSSHINPFPCTIKPRSEAALRLIQEASGCSASEN